MLKSKKFIVLASVLAVVLVFVATAGIVLAQDANSKAGPNKMMARVAEILGIDQQKLNDAFKQARDEFQAQNPRPDNPRAKNPEELLNKLVQDGKLTQPQADQLKAWWAAKPANPKDDPQGFQNWLKSRPDIPLPKMQPFPGRHFRPGGNFPSAPPATQPTA